MNKEEIEKAKKECREIIGNFKSATTELTKDIFPKKANAIEILLEYINQLETSKQKLIDKLEEIIKETSKNISPETMKKYQNVEMDKISDETYILLALHRIGLAGEFLEIVKGEKNV